MKRNIGRELKEKGVSFEAIKKKCRKISDLKKLDKAMKGG